MRYRTLLLVLRILTLALMVRVLGAILANYPDYFPPNFDAFFLQGRESTFTPTYAVAFYVHILVSPLVLVNALILLSDSVRQRYRRVHRTLGWVQAAVVLLLMLPSSVMMAMYAFTGWPAGLSFLLLSILTAICMVTGIVYARRRRYTQHRRWMWRTTILLGSAVTLRLISGAAGLIEVPSTESAYIVAAWASWLVPLAVYEVGWRWAVIQSRRQADTRAQGVAEL